MCDSEDEMEEKIMQLVDDDKMRKEFGKNSLELTSQFSIANHIKRTLFVYDEVMKAYPKKINDEDVMRRMKEAIK